MTQPPVPSAPDSGGPDEPVNLGKSSDPTSDVPFDPYRFGKPDRPVPPEYAPPGYGGTGYTPVPQPSPYAPPPTAPAQPPPYQGYPYPGGAPMPPSYHGYPQPRTGNGKATAALVLGILSIVFFWLSILDVVLVILALVFGLLGLAESRRQGGSGRGMAIAGLVCMGVGAVAAMLWTATLVHAVNQCGGFDGNTNSSVFEQCVSDHLPWSS